MLNLSTCYVARALDAQEAEVSDLLGFFWA